MRLVDADELKEAMLEESIWLENADAWVANNVIDKMPTVNPVKQGKWEKIPKGYNWWKCTQCKHTIQSSGWPRYCECCGAKMDGDEE